MREFIIFLCEDLTNEPLSNFGEKKEKKEKVNMISSKIHQPSPWSCTTYLPIKKRCLNQINKEYVPGEQHLDSSGHAFKAN